MSSSKSRLPVRLVAPTPSQPSLEAFISVESDGGIKLYRASNDALVCALPVSTLKGFSADSSGLVVLKATRNGQLGEIKLEGSGADPASAVATLRERLRRNTPVTRSRRSSATKAADAGVGAERKTSTQTSATKAAAERAAQLKAKIAAQ